MAREDYQKKIAGYTLSTNSLLEKMLMVTEETFSVIEDVHSVVVQGLAVSDRTAEILEKQNDILTEIRDLLKDPSKATKGSGGGRGPKLGKLAQAGGIVALMGLGIITFTTAFKMAGGVSPNDIQSAILVSLAMIPVSHAFAKVIEAIPTSMIMNPKFMVRATLSLAAMAAGYALIAVAIRATPIISGPQLMNSIAVAGVFYIVGSIFAQLLVALTHNGLFSFFMNKNRVQQTMGSMVIMAGSLLLIALAVSLTPRITLQQAGAFAIVSLAMIPLAIAFKQLKWVFVLSRKFKVSDVKKTAIMLGIVALAIIPLGFAASLVPALNPRVIDSLFSLAMVMIPISIIVSLITSAITGGGNKGMMNRVLGPAAPKEKKEKKPIDKGSVVKWIGISLLAVGALVLVAIGLSKAAPYLAGALTTISSLDMGAMLKLIFVVGLAGFIVAGIVNLMRGKGESTSTGGFLGIYGGSKSSSGGKISMNDMIVAALALPVVALGLVATAWIFQLLPEKFNTPPVMWTVGAALSILLFSVPLTALSFMSKKIGSKDMINGMIAMTVISFSILIVAYAFSLLPDKYVSIPVGWSIGAAIALTIFGIPLFILGKMGAGGIQAILYGAAGAILIAVAILAISWILSYIPADKLASVASGLTTALLAPVNGIIDVFGRLKNEIGIENLLPLAGGIIALSVALMTLAGASVGIAAGGVISAIGNVATAIADSVAKFFGGEKSKGPLEILEFLTNKVGAIEKLAPAITTVATGLGKVAMYSGSALDNLNKWLTTLTTSSFDKQANALERIANAYTKVSTASRTMNVEGIQKTTEMIKALAYLSEVGGDNAMEKLGDSLISAVKELANMIANFDETVKEQGNNSASATGGLKDAVSGLINKFNSLDSSGGSIDSGGSDFDSDEVVDVLERVLRQLQTGVKTIPA
jgi:TM2 domain-containing membrane protein YozV